MKTGREERGFALLALLLVVGFGIVGVLVAVQRLVPSSAKTATETDRRFNVMSRALRFAYRRDGVFPADLDSLATATGLDSTASWRTDPWSPPNDFNYGVVASGTTVRGRGPDGALNTSDDLLSVVPTEELVRVRQRGRERMLRAVLLRSAYCYSASMSATDVASMRTAMQNQAIARRSWLTADAATRVTLQATLTSSANTVSSLRASYSCPPIPARLVGGGGLMQQLGMPDARCYDGLGRRFLRDPILGVLSAGADRRRGTDDDM